ncbi:hypothetical protein EMIHUDRAFT_194568 [Emiliania huxleyi CCMP1516]|uniref:Rhodanese domain-containing protein n=2 Tax=Emiliania huxleyi TaxID=2903 RepID=A0A0D3L1R9_EMIH1|nr:hypothetical protein EMIHUDRAFT_194568 [Emiliania huxleyi CCMP1516]EOD41954.1 hypothetical protein EMIHUDRAFT_194568 [Emiliania huxleyi CCMP1516]|eukprot:XP_005794383.1 hypothetical protein EMIHUDRAFT_194568 [Emiliania huxleyi CCMP1516]
MSELAAASSSSSAVVPAQAVPTINRPLPPVPPEARRLVEGKEPISILLFYQYVEPPWTDKECSSALKHFLALGKEHSICGRGRCAKEGLNCTLTGNAAGLRAFCEALRAWKPELFNQTDFKFTDGLPASRRFKALTVRKTDELVAYGLAGERAPALAASSAKHPDAVVIDVRNAYESAIGHFAPPEGGATLLDPKMRNSREFPKWLADEKTKEALSGKKVLMYCTGGIRCERATALLDEMVKADPTFRISDITMVRGGVERYMRTFPEGGFWKGKNYLFDRRLEQVPEAKSSAALEGDVESWCAVCAAPWAAYRGQFKCAGRLPPPAGVCAVPVIVCNRCSDAATADPASLRCPLCQEGYVAPQAMPEVVMADKRAPDQRLGGGRAKKQRPLAEPSSRVFVGSLPFVVDATASGLFYGSAFVQMGSVEAATTAVGAAREGRLRIGKRKLRLNFAPLKPGEEWPAVGFVQRERPLSG